MQESYDEAMYVFSRGDYAEAVARLEAVLRQDPGHFDAQLSLGMAWSRLGDQARAIAEGHRAEQLRPREQLVHTNLSLFYLKAGDKGRAEHHALQARLASWRGNLAPPGAAAPDPDALPQAREAGPRLVIPDEFPDMPWKRKPAPPADASSSASSPSS